MAEPIRKDRVVRITIEDSMQPRTIVLIRQRDLGERMGRWYGIGERGLTGMGIGRLIGEYLR